MHFFFLQFHLFLNHWWMLWRSAIMMAWIISVHLCLTNVAWTTTHHPYLTLRWSLFRMVRTQLHSQCKGVVPGALVRLWYIWNLQIWFIMCIMLWTSSNYRCLGGNLYKKWNLRWNIVECVHRLKCSCVEIRYKCNSSCWVKLCALLVWSRRNVSDEQQTRK